MDENYNKTRRYGSLFDRIKDSILSKSAAGQEEQEDTEESALPNPAEESKQDEPAKISVSIPANSLLYSLWQEWNENEGNGGTEGSNDAANKEDGENTGVRGNQPEPLNLVFDDADFDKVSMSEADIEMEKKRATLTLMMKARKHFMATRPNEEGVTPTVDAEAVIHVSKDHMAAWAFVFPPSGEGKPIQQAQLELALMEYSVCAGIDRDILKHIIDEQPYFELILVAVGTPPIEGEQGYIIEHYERSMEKSFGMDEKGKIDYHIQNNIQEIHAGDVICEAVPPVPGKDGIDVLGATLHAKEALPAKFAAGKNTTVSEDKMKLLASMDGHLAYKGGKFHVEPTYYVRGDVDLHVGNINFLGDVQISGNVRENFVIQATGNVFVGGLVEGAVIEAGGDVTITNGVLGEDKAVIQAGGNVRAEYIESSIVYAGGDVYAGSIISSMIHSDNKIEARFGRGTIIGGKLIAGRLINADIIGCRAERLTTLVVGELPYVQKQKEEIAVALEQIEQEMAEIERTLSFVEKRDIDDVDPKLAQKAADYRLRKSVLGMQTSHLKKQLEDLKEKQEDLSGCKITADTIYPVTQIQIMELFHTVREQSVGYNNVHIENGAIVMV